MYHIFYTVSYLLDNHFLCPVLTCNYMLWCFARSVRSMGGLAADACGISALLQLVQGVFSPLFSGIWYAHSMQGVRQEGQAQDH